MNEKKCHSCQETKPTGDFYENRNTKDGYSYECKDCAKLRDRKYRQSEQGKRRKKEYKQTDKWKAADKRYRASDKVKRRDVTRSAKYRKQHPEKRKAHAVVNYAIKLGKLPHISNRNCVECGQPAKEYHHHMGYNEANRLNVVPVCKKCHIKIEQM